MGHASWMDAPACTGWRPWPICTFPSGSSGESKLLRNSLNTLSSDHSPLLYLGWWFTLYTLRQRKLLNTPHRRQLYTPWGKENYCILNMWQRKLLMINFIHSKAKKITVNLCWLTLYTPRQRKLLSDQLYTPQAKVTLWWSTLYRQQQSRFQEDTNIVQTI